MIQILSLQKNKKVTLTKLERKTDTDKRNCKSHFKIINNYRKSIIKINFILCFRNYTIFSFNTKYLTMNRILRLKEE